MKRKLLEIILVACLFFPLPGFFLQGRTDPGGGFSGPMLNYISIALPQVFVLVYILYLQKAPLADFGIRRPRKETWLWLAFTFGVALCISLLVSTLYRLVPPDQAHDLLKAQSLSIRDPIEIPLAALFCIAVGVREELFFRSYLITRLSELGVKPVWAILGSSVVFGVGHLNQGPLGIGAIFVIGLVFGIVYHFKRDLTSLAGAHACYNFTLLMLAFLGSTPSG